MKTFISIMALALLPAAATAADRPDWAFPSKPPGPAVVEPPDSGQPTGTNNGPGTGSDEVVLLHLQPTS